MTAILPPHADSVKACLTLLTVWIFTAATPARAAEILALKPPGPDSPVCVVTFGGSDGEEITIQRSADLITWHSFAPVTVRAGIPGNIAFPWSAKACFFRAIGTPEEGAAGRGTGREGGFFGKTPPEMEGDFRWDGGD